MTVSRREAVERLGYAAAGAFGVGAMGNACSAPAPAPAPASARVSGGRTVPLGVQLYTVRDAMQEDVEATLARVAAIGYREVEFWQYYGRAARHLRQTLDAEGLVAPSVHVPIEALAQDPEELFETAGTLGHRYLVVAWMPEQMRTTLDDWKRTAELFNRIGETARSAGFQYAYHNHDFEFVPVEGRVPFDLLGEETDPDLVQIELDLYWIVHGGGDPIALFERWPGRVPMVHVKDRTADGQMVDVGAGVINWAGIFAHRQRAGIRHYFVEHDTPSDPFASIAASYDYVSGLDLS